MINNKDSHIPSPLIIFTCTALSHALLGRQKNKGVHPKASKSKQKADKPDHWNYFNHQNDGGKIARCCAVTGRKLFTSAGVADIYIFMIITWNTLPESYQKRVYNNSLATVKHRIQQAENPTPAAVISVHAAGIDNAIFLDSLDSEVGLEEPEIGSTDPNIPINNNCSDNALHFCMPGGTGDYQDEGDESVDRIAIHTASRQRRPTTELERFHLGVSDVDPYGGEDGDDADADADEEEESSQVDDGSTQNVME